MKLQVPNFASKSELYQYLISNKADLIDIKKSAQKFSDAFSLVDSNPVWKGILANPADNENEIKRTIVGNTYNWMDSHDDVHLDNVFSDSIKHKGERVRHLHDHLYQLSARVGIPTKVYEQLIAWSDLGVEKAGYTMALFMDSEIKRKLNETIFDAYKTGEIDQHSVAMQYCKIDLAVNNPEAKAEYAIWQKHIDQIGNKEKALDKGFFWAVKEAKLFEISCVLEGSNELTPVLDTPKGSPIKIDPAPSSPLSFHSFSKVLS